MEVSSWQQKVSFLLQTIRNNIQTGYDGALSQTNIKNILHLYGSVYEEESTEEERESIYDKLKIQIKDGNQRRILQWFENQRGTKYSGDILPRAKLLQNLRSIKVCPNPDYIYPSRFVTSGKNVSVKLKASLEPVTIGLSFFQVKLSKELNKSYLYRGTKNREPRQTPWLVEKTKDKRYVWRGDIQLDRKDVQTLLKFIFAKRSLHDQCPSVLVNAGSHGGSFGQNSNQSGSLEYTDMKIYEETIDTICNLVEGREFKLCKENVEEKICVHALSSVDPCVYPEMADHIIDVQCLGAFSMIEASSLHHKASNIFQTDLLFRSQEQKSLALPIQPYQGELISHIEHKLINTLVNEVVLHSHIIKNEADAKRFLKMFEREDTGFLGMFSHKYVVKNAVLLFRASEHAFELEEFFRVCGYIRNTCLLCMTEGNKIVGAFTPLEHEYKKSFWSASNLGQWVKDNSKSSFIFSVTTNDKFLLKDPEHAIFRCKDRNRVVFGLEEFAISSKDDQKKNGCSNINFVYFNAKYSQTNAQNCNENDSCSRFNGTDSVYFQTKEWEVWHINVEEQ